MPLRLPRRRPWPVRLASSLLLRLRLWPLRLVHPWPLRLRPWPIRCHLPALRRRAPGAEASGAVHTPLGPCRPQSVRRWQRRWRCRGGRAGCAWPLPLHQALSALRFGRAREQRRWDRCRSTVGACYLPESRRLTNHRLTNHSLPQANSRASRPFLPAIQPLPRNLPRGSHVAWKSDGHLPSRPLPPSHPRARMKPLFPG